MLNRFKICFTISICISCMLILLSCDIAKADSEDLDLTELDLLELMEVEMETTSARRELKVTESPSTISIISREDIENSWATNIPDLLRNTLGIDVIGIYSGTHMVSLRGSNPFSSLKVAILIDGQLLEPLMYGTAVWNQLPVPINDIEKIEVVRSPGVLYGANAFHGLVNIITKSPTEKTTHTVSTTGGEIETFIGTAQSSGRIGRFGYRVSIEKYQADEYPKEENKYKFDRTSDRHATGNALINYTSKDGTSVTTATLADNRYHHWDRLPDRLCETYVQGDHRYARLKYKKDLSEESNYEIRLNHNFSSFELTNNRARIADPFVPDLHKSKSSIFFQHASPFMQRHHFVWGTQATLEKTRDRGENNFLRDDMNRGLYGFYIQDQISLKDNLKLFVGGRVSHHYVTDFNISSSANLVYTFNERHTLRLSATRVVREPNIYETYMSYAQPSGVSGKVGWYKGNTDLDAEINHALELGYQFRKPGIKFEAVGFIYDTKDIIENRHTGNATVNGVFLPVMQFFNMTDTRIFGAEVGGEWSVNDKLKFTLNSSFQSLDSDSHIPTHTEGRMGDGYAPEWKVNTGVDYQFYSKLRGTLFMNYVDDVVWERPVWKSSSGAESISTPSEGSYNTVNLNLAWKPAERVKISFKAFNILDTQHMEWAPVASSFNSRRALINITFSF